MFNRPTFGGHINFEDFFLLALFNCFNIVLVSISICNGKVGILYIRIIFNIPFFLNVLKLYFHSLLHPILFQIKFEHNVLLMQILLMLIAD